MWTHKFWFDDVIDGMAFMASSIVGSKGIDKIGKAAGVYSKIGKALGNTTRAAKTGKLAVGAGSKMANVIEDMNLLTMTSFNSISEAAFEAKDLKDQLIDQLDLYVRAGKMTQEEANAKASQAAFETFGFNVLALMPSNYLTNSFIFKKPTRVGKLPVFSKGAEGTLGELTKTSQAGIFGKSALKSMLSEGAYEENIQLAIQDYEDAKAKGTMMEPWYRAIAKGMADNFTTKEGKKSILLGSLIGLLPGGVGGVKEAKQQRKLDTLANDMYRGAIERHALGIKDIAKKKTTVDEEGNVKESGEFDLDDQGNYKIDKDKVQAAFLAQYGEFTDFVSALKAAYNGNEIMYEYIQNHRVASLGFPFYYMKDGVELFKDYLTSEKMKETEMLQASGKEVNEEVLSEIEDKYVRKAEDFNKLYNYIDQRFVQFFDFGKSKYAQKYKNIVLAKAFEEGVSQQFWSEKKEQLESKIKELTEKEGDSIYEQTSPADVKELNRLKDQLKHVDVLLERSKAKVKDLLNEKIQKEEAKKYIEKREAAEKSDGVDNTLVEDIENRMSNKKDTEDSTPKTDKHEPTNVPQASGKWHVITPTNDLESRDEFDDLTALSYGYEYQEDESTSNKKVYNKVDPERGMKHTVVTTGNDVIVQDMLTFDKEATDSDGNDVSVGINFENNKLLSVKVKDNKTGEIKELGTFKKPDGEEYTSQDLPELAKFLLEDKGLDIDLTDREDKVILGGDGNIETIAPNEKADNRKSAIETEYGIKHSGSAAAYVKKEDGRFITINPEFEVDVINIPKGVISGASFEASIDEGNAVWSNFPNKIKEAILAGNLTDAQIDELISLKNINSFNNIVDRVPIKYTFKLGNKTISEGIFLHDTAFPFITIPQEIYNIKDKKEREAAAERHRLREQLRTRKLRGQVLRKLLKGEQVVFNGYSKTVGHINNTGTIRGLADVLSRTTHADNIDGVGIGIAESIGTIYINNGTEAIGFGIAGNVFLETNSTANGETVYIKLNPNKIHPEHARIIYNAYVQAFTKGKGGFKAIYEGDEVKGDLTVKEVLDLLVHQGEVTKIDIKDPKNKNKAHLINKQLYVDTKAKTINFGTESIPLYDATEAEIDHFITYLSTNKNYTISKNKIGNKLGKSFTIGKEAPISYKAGTSETYVGMIIRGGYLSTDVDVVTGTKSLTKQPAVIYDVLGANMDFSSEQVDDARVKAVEEQNAREHAGRVQQPTTTAPTTTTAEPKPPVEIEYNKILLESGKNFVNLSDGSFIFFEKDGNTVKIGQIKDGYFHPTKKATDKDLIKLLGELGTFKIDNQAKIRQFDKGFGGFMPWIKAAQPVEIPLPSKSEEQIKEEDETPIPPPENPNEEGEDLDDILPVYRSTTWAPENYNVIDLEKELSWLNDKFKRNIFGKNLTTLQLDKLIEIAGDKHSFGQFQRDAILIFKNAEEGTVYHEAFHRVSLGYLTPSQRAALYESAKKYYNMPTAKESVLEEMLAEDFRSYMINRIENKPQPKTLRGKVKEFFKNIFDFLYTFFTGDVRLTKGDIQGLFKAIDKGKFKYARISKKRYQQLKDMKVDFEVKGVQFDHIENYKAFKEVVNNMFKLLVESSGLMEVDPETGETTNIFLSNMEDVNKLEFSKLFKTLEDKSKRLKEAAAKNAKQAPVMMKIANLFDEILKNRETMQLAVEDYMRSMKILRTSEAEEIDEINGLARSELSKFQKNSFEIDSKQNTQNTIKLLISMLPASNRRSSLTGLTSLVEFGPTWARLYYGLEGSTGPENMMERLQAMADDNFTYQVLNDKLKQDENLKTQFYVTFNKQNLNFIDSLVSLEDGAEIRFNNAKVSNAASTLVRDWSADFFLSSKFFKRTEGKSPVKYPDAYAELIDEYKKLIKDVIKDYKRNAGTLSNVEEFSSKLRALYNEIGVPLTPLTLDNLVDVKNRDYSEGLFQLITKELAYPFTEQSSIFKHLLGERQSRVTSENVLASESTIRRIAEAYAQTGNFDLGNMVLGPEGNRYYTITQNTYMSDIVKLLRQNPEEVKRRLSAHYNKNSRFLNKLLQDPEALEILTQSTFRRVDEGAGDRGREYQKLTELEDFLNRMAAIRAGFLIPPTPADRKFYYYFKGMDQVNVNLDNAGNFNDEVIEVYQKYYEDEVARVHAVREELRLASEGRGKLEDLYEFYHFRYVGRSPELYKENKYTPQEGDVIMDGKLLYRVDPGTGQIVEYYGRGANLTDFKGFDLGWGKAQVRANIQKILKERLKKDIRYAKRIGALQRFGEDTKLENNLLPVSMLEEISNDLFGTTEWEDNKQSVLENAIARFMVNNAIGVFESNKAFTGDPAAFKDTEDELKRLTGYTSTGDNLRTSFPEEFYPNDELVHSPTYNVVYFDSHVFKSSMYDELFEKHVKAYQEEGLAENEEEARKMAKLRLKAYEKVDQTDGQTLISPSMYRAISIKVGEWPAWKEQAYQIMQKDPYSVTKSEQLLINDVVMQPLKMVYMRVEYNNGNAIPVYDKMSLATLFRPIYEGTQMEEVIDRMEATGKYEGMKPIHQLKFNTATKTGIKDRRPIFKNKTENELTDLTVLDDSIYPQHFESLRRQLVTDPHEVDTVLAGSQMQKVGVANINKEASYQVGKDEMQGKDLLKHFNDVRAELSNKGRRKFLSDLGVNENLEFSDIGILLAKMKEEALKSNMPGYIAETYNTDENGDKLLEFDAVPGNRKWTEARFLSLNKKATIDLDLPGNSFIQMTDIGLKKIKKDTTVDHDSALKMNNERGFIEGKVSVSLFKKMIPNYDTISDDARIAYLKKHPELTSVGYRIPTQGPNSLYLIEFVDFLPATVGDVIILPGEGTALGGFDFDIDKLYVIRHNYDRKNNKIEYRDDTNSTAEERYVDWINDNAEKDIIKYMNVLKRGEIKKIKEKYKESVSKIKEWLGSELDTNKSALKDDLNMQLDNAYREVKRTANVQFLEETFRLNKLLFKHVNPDTKIRYYELRDDLNKRNIKGIQRFQAFLDFTTLLINTGHTQAQLLEQMSDMYIAQMEAFGMSGDYIKKRMEELKTKFVDQYKELKDEDRNENIEDYLYLKSKEQATKDEELFLLNFEAAVYIAQLSNLPSFGTFEALPMEQQNVRKALENRLIDVFYGVGINKHSYVLKTTPLGFAGDVLKEFSKKVRELRGEDAKFAGPLSRTSLEFQMDVKARFKFGGKGIGPNALANVHHMLGQSVELGLFFDLGIGNTVEVQPYTTVNEVPIPLYFEGNIQPDANTIFVFGSNPEGRHGAGAAKIAKEKFGATYGKGEGLQGSSYALPTKDLRVKENKGLKSISPEQITESIKELYKTALENPNKQFKIAYRNTTSVSLNGYTGIEMIEMFNNAGIIPENIIFSKEWYNTGLLSESRKKVKIDIQDQISERVTTLSGILGKDNEYITEWISALIDAHVDIAADPYIYYLNVNEVTQDVLLGLIRAGVGGMTSVKFIAQPSLVEMSELQENNKNKLDYKIKNPIGAVINRYKYLMEDAAERQEFFEEVSFDPDNLSELFSENALDNGLDANREHTAEWYNYQLNVLRAFSYLDKVLGKPLSAAVMSSRVDTKKFGSNVSEYRQYQKSVNEAYKASKNGTGIRNFDKLLDESYLSNMTDNSINLVNDILKGHLLEATPAFAALTDKVLELNGTDPTRSKAEDLTQVSNELYTVIASGFFAQEGYLERKRVINLIKSENSVPRRITRYKKGELKDVELLHALHSVYNDNTPDFVIYDKPEDPGQKDSYSTDWLNMYTHENPEIRQFAEDLFIYSYLTSGFKTSIYSFFDLAPAALLRDIGYNEYIKNVLQDFNDYNFVPDPDLIKEIYVNAWNNNTVLNEVKDYEIDEGNKLMSEGYTFGFITNKTIVGYNDKGQPVGKPFVRYRDGDVFNIYKYSGYRLDSDNKFELLYTYETKKSRFVKGHLLKETLMDGTMFKINKPHFSDNINKFIKDGVIVDFVKSKAEFKDFVDIDNDTVVRSEEEVQNKTSDQLKEHFNNKTAEPIKFQPDNIEMIKSGRKTITNRTSANEAGVRIMPDGGIIELELLGEAFVKGDAIQIKSQEGNILQINKDAIAFGEGFENWADFEKNNKFSKNFVEGNASRFIYKIYYKGQRMPDIEEVKQNKKECNG